jgi:nitrate reductase gamma subunit
MTLLELARGPALRVALFVFLAGAAWRLVGTLFLRRQRPPDPPRDPNAFRGGMRTVFSRFWTHPDYTPVSAWHMGTAYVYHLGLLLVLLLFAPHIEFLSGILGFSWPGLPSGLVTLVAGASVAALVAVLIRRLLSPVLRTISRTDDWLSWLLLFLPFVTGMLATAHLLLPYPTMLGVHILSVDLLLVWFPFGKLMHAFFVFPGRYALGAAYRRKGVVA